MMVFDEIVVEMRKLRRLMLEFQKGVNDLRHEIKLLRKDIREIIELKSR